MNHTQPQYQLHLGDCLDILPTLADSSIHLLISDWPYFGVKSDEWDNQWKSRDDFLGWIDAVCEQYQRVLAPNGSLYAFASPQMAWHVEGVMQNRFNVLNNIRWQKPEYSTKAEMFDKDMMRGYFPSSETVLFCEQYGADKSYQGAIIDGESDYWTACETAKQGVFGGYLESEFHRAKVTRKQIAALFPSKTGGLTGCVSNWVLGYNIPTPEQYQAMRDYLNSLNCKTDYLRREYEDLRREYEDLRRPFNTTPQLPYTDVWTYPTVNTYNGKHPCEKPLQMMLDIVTISSREGDTVADFFFGSGVSGQAAGMLKRKYIGVERDPRHFEKGRRRIAAGFRDWNEAMVIKDTTPSERGSGQLPLWEMT